MPKTIQMTVKVGDNEVVVPFTLPKIIAISMREIDKVIPNLTDIEGAQFFTWAENAATARHTHECEFDFAVQPQDPDWVKNIGVPEKFVPIFEAAHLTAQDMTKNEKEDVIFRIFAE